MAKSDIKKGVNRLIKRDATGHFFWSEGVRGYEVLCWVI